MNRFVLTMFGLTVSGCLLTGTLTAQTATLSHNSNLRKEPSTRNEILETLPSGSQVTIVSRFPRDGYVRVQTDDRKRVGWVIQRNVRPVTTNVSAPLARPHALHPQPETSSRVGEAEIYPNATSTPGAADPTVIQDNIAENICNKGWTTGSVRPSTSVTNKIKGDTMRAYGFTDPPNHYELDHLISLQNGGCPDCVENLWPEAYGDSGHPMTQIERAAWNRTNSEGGEVLPGSLEKDVVENHIHDEICYGVPDAKRSSLYDKYPPTVQITLERGQQILATDWYACYQKMMNNNNPCQ